MQNAIKIYFGDQIRRFNVDKDNTLTFEGLIQKLFDLFSTSCAAHEITYKDQEGDYVLVTSEEEWKEALRLSHLKTLHIHLREAKLETSRVDFLSSHFAYLASEAPPRSVISSPTPSPSDVISLLEALQSSQQLLNDSLANGTLCELVRFTLFKIKDSADILRTFLAPVWQDIHEPLIAQLTESDARHKAQVQELECRQEKSKIEAAQWKRKAEDLQREIDLLSEELEARDEESKRQEEESAEWRLRSQALVAELDCLREEYAAFAAAHSSHSQLLPPAVSEQGNQTFIPGREFETQTLIPAAPSMVINATQTVPVQHDHTHTQTVVVLASVGENSTQTSPPLLSEISAAALSHSQTQTVALVSGESSTQTSSIPLTSVGTTTTTTSEQQEVPVPSPLATSPSSQASSTSSESDDFVVVEDEQDVKPQVQSSIPQIDANLLSEVEIESVSSSVLAPPHAAIPNVEEPAPASNSPIIQRTSAPNIIEDYGGSDAPMVAVVTTPVIILDPLPPSTDGSTPSTQSSTMSSLHETGTSILSSSADSDTEVQLQISEEELRRSFARGPMHSSLHQSFSSAMLASRSVGEAASASGAVSVGPVENEFDPVDNEEEMESSLFDQQQQPLTPPPVVTPTVILEPVIAVIEEVQPQPEVPEVETPKVEVEETPAAVVVEKQPEEEPEEPEDPEPRARFVRDVSCPDGTPVKAGELFQKRWLIKNTGEGRWPKGTRLVYQNGLKMGAVDSMDVESAKSGQEVEVGVYMAAPKSLGYARSYWRLWAPNGTPEGRSFGQKIWAEVLVEPNPNSQDPRMSQYGQQVAKLLSMGFQDIPKNLDLLQKHKGDVEAVLDELLNP